MIEWGLEWHRLDSYFEFKEITAPGTPEANGVRLYGKDSSGTSTLCYKNDAGTEICLPTSGSFVTGTGVSGRVAFWNGTSTLSSDADLTFVTDTLTATKIIAPTSITISALTAGSIVFAGTAGLLSQDNANFFWDDTNNRLGIGTTTPDRALQVTLSGSATQPVSLYNYSGGATTPIDGIIFRAARGTVGTPTAVQADDTAVVLAFQGYGATGFSSGKRASVEMLSGENWSDTAQGTYLRFMTTALTGTTIAERFRVGPSGQWGIGGATYGSSGDYFKSGGSGAAPSWGSPAALTKTDDTNVTLTLGGSPTTALLNAASLTLGWTGTLAISRGGTGQSTANAAFNALAPSQSSNSGKFLTTNGTDTSWGTVSGYLTKTGCEASRNLGSTQTISTGTLTAVNLPGTETFDTDSFHDTSTNNTRITIPTGKDGLYLLWASIVYDGNATGIRTMLFRKNGTTFVGVLQVSNGGTSTVALLGTKPVDLVAGDYVELIAYQDSGGNLNIGTNDPTYFGALKLT